MSRKNVLEDKRERVFSDEEIKELIRTGAIYSRTGSDLEKQVQPASIDTTISSIGWEVPYAMVFNEKENLSTLDYEYKRLRKNSEGYFILEPNHYYIFLLNECVDLDLYKDVHVESNPKSSVGRADLFTRLVTDSKNKFESLREGYRGPLGVLLESKTFRIGLKEGVSLNQLRFQIGKPEFTTLELHKKYLETALLIDEKENAIPKYNVSFDNGLLLTLNLESAVYKAKKNVKEILYLDKDRNKNENECADPEVFFEKIIPEKKVLELEKDDFILACTDEIINFPKDTCGELESYNDKLSPDARIHYAGFVDPGWTSRLTYEIRSNEKKLRLTHKMQLARIKYLKMGVAAKKGYKNLKKHYGNNIDTYAELPKFFKKFGSENEKLLRGVKNESIFRYS